MLVVKLEAGQRNRKTAGARRKEVKR